MLEPDEMWLRASVDVADSEFRSKASRWHVVHGLFCLLFALIEQQQTPRLSAIAVANGTESPQKSKKSRQRRWMTTENSQEGAM